MQKVTVYSERNGRTYSTSLVGEVVTYELTTDGCLLIKVLTSDLNLTKNVLFHRSVWQSVTFEVAVESESGAQDG